MFSKKEEPTTRLRELRGSDYTIAKGQPDIRGWDVRDGNGRDRQPGVRSPGRRRDGRAGSAREEVREAGAKQRERIGDADGGSDDHGHDRHVGDLAGVGDPLELPGRDQRGPARRHRGRAADGGLERAAAEALTHRS